MLQLLNSTPFSAKIVPIPDRQGVETLYIIIKAQFEINHNHTQISPEQPPIQVADEYIGDPTNSSLWTACEVHLDKPGTDVVVRGDAFTPHKRRQLDVSVSVGPLTKVVRVFGFRTWRGGRATQPEPFQRQPILYEDAFGGIIGRGKDGAPLHDRRNPIGVGAGHLPKIEDPSDLIKTPQNRPQPAGFGFIAPHWEPRRSRVGTYNDQWKRTRAPYLPVDFCNTFFHAAHPDLVASPHLKGGEPVRLINFYPSPMLAFSLPKCAWQVEVHSARSTATPAMNLESVVFDPSAASFTMLWRGAYRCDKHMLQVDKVELQLEQLEYAS